MFLKGVIVALESTYHSLERFPYIEIEGKISGKSKLLDIWDCIAHGAYVAGRYDFWIFSGRTRF